MLSENVFKNCLVGLCKMNGVAIESDTLRMYYAKVKNDFTDNEFRAIANDILETENLYGKFPAPVLFYSRKKQAGKKSGDSAFLIARQAFQDKVMEFVNNDYNTKQAIKEFNDSLTASEVAALSALGGLTALWGACRKDGVFIDEKADWTIRRIQDKFKEHYNAPADDRLRIAEEKDAEMLLKIENLTAAAIKRIN